MQFAAYKYLGPEKPGSEWRKASLAKISESYPSTWADKSAWVMSKEATKMTTFPNGNDENTTSFYFLPHSFGLPNLPVKQPFLIWRYCLVPYPEAVQKPTITVLANSWRIFHSLQGFKQIPSDKPDFWTFSSSDLPLSRCDIHDVGSQGFLYSNDCVLGTLGIKSKDFNLQNSAVSSEQFTPGCFLMFIVRAMYSTSKSRRVFRRLFNFKQRSQDWQVNHCCKC